jgi:dipeptidyl aminopeptidase/acylaminoacyl peptidase
MQAGYRQWGLKMQEDLMDGLTWLVGEGVTDPEKVCVVGASYGGYTALVSAYKFSDRVTCAVSMAGISDLEKMVERFYSFELVKRNRERIQPSAQLAANSPIHQVEAIRVPLLLLHGDRDTVVRVKQSRRMARALEESGKPFRYVEQANGDHFLSMESQRMEFFAELDRFLDEHLN